ncbi:MAG TPA: hypothetical protein VN282_06710 [Pyrinomonadaceae bacterium]|nr:hypothetical protein [Pyrinomonadaceae bacterium]
MPFALLLALAAIAGATVLTYSYDREANIWARLCAGVCLGFSALGLVGFVLASALGMGPAALALAGVVCASPLLLLARADWRQRVGSDLREGVRAVTSPGREREGAALGTFVFYAVAALLFWLVYARAMYQTPEGIFTGVDTNIGDMPFHLAVVTGFVYGENFPPQHPEFAGAGLTYPFVVDFVAAMFVRAGASLEGALFWQSYATIMAVVGLLHRWALKLTRERLAALAVPALVLLSGGLGWVVFLREAASGGQGVFALLGELPHDYTRAYPGFEWGNAVTALFVTQRSILLGVGVALVAWTLWWQASEKSGVRSRESEGGGEKDASAQHESRRVGKKKVKGKGRAALAASARSVVEDEEAAADNSPAFILQPFALRQMIAAGVVAGLLPLVHAHSFVVMMLMGACMALAQGAAVFFSKTEEVDEVPLWMKVWAVWRPWLLFAAVATVLALPQMFYATRDSAVRAGQFFGWEFGWAHGQTNVVWFWLKNTAVFIPLLVVALAWRGAGVSKRLLFFYLPFLLCFVVPNVYRFAPWVWDNIKILLYWWVASAPLVALVLARLWRRGGAWRAAGVVLLLMQTAAGGLDVWRAASGAVERRSFDRDGVAFAEVIKQQTGPRSLILHAPTYNDPVYLAGRRTFLGYPGHVWSHGIDYGPRESELKRIYAGAADAPLLIERAGIEYVVVGPLEREEMRQRGLSVNDSFFARYRKVGEAGAYRLYKTKP